MQLLLLFPGQGSQKPGMAKHLAEQFPAARAVFDEADQAAGFPLSRLCFEGLEEEVKVDSHVLDPLRMEGEAKVDEDHPLDRAR